MPDQQETRLGQQVGEYRLVHKLGGGGFGTVYLAEHMRKHTQVAVKVLSLPLTKPGDFKDFLNEVRTVLLSHPHIVPLLDFGISRDDLPFLVMEYASSGTLRDRHPKGDRVSLSTIVSYVDQIASALQYAHDQHIIHRDVKPENILVRADGTLLVSDFGIAKFLEQSVLISVQTQVGTPVYMAPEQYRGHPCFASDQYALGIVIYEWICGVRPFQGLAIGLAVQHMNTPPPRLRDHLPELSEDIEHVILKALAKVPEERFGRIQEFADALRETMQPLPSTRVLSPPIEARNTAPLVPPQQVSQLVPAQKPEAWSHQEQGSSVDLDLGVDQDENLDDLEQEAHNSVVTPQIRGKRADALSGAFKQLGPDHTMTSSLPKAFLDRGPDEASLSEEDEESLSELHPTGSATRGTQEQGRGKSLRILLCL